MWRRFAATIQIILSVLNLIGCVGFFVGMVFHRRGFRSVAGFWLYVILLFGATLWLVGSIHLRKARRWAWLVSISIACFLLIVFAYRLALQQVRLEQIALIGPALIVDVILLIGGRQALTD